MCTSIMAGKEATAGGVAIVSRNEDFVRNNWNKYLTYRPLPQYKVPGTPSVAGEVWTLGNGMAVPVPEAAHPYSAMPDAAGASEASSGIGDGFYFEERGVNGRNVAVSATNSMTSNERAEQADPFVSPGVAESVIPTLILPQAHTARHGVRLLGSYVEERGAQEPNGVLIADLDECWYVEIGSGHHWIAVRVPGDAYIAVANGMRVHGVDLDADGTLHSAGLFDWVRDNRLLAHPDRHSFDFAQAFGIPGVPYNVDRIWLAQSILTPSLHQRPRLPRYPLFLRPDAPMRVTDVMRVLRATYKGTVLDGVAERPIGYEKTAESHIITLDPAMPPELAALIWQAVSTPLGAPYVPLYSVTRELPASYTSGGNVFSPVSAYWAFHGAHVLRLHADEAVRARVPDWAPEFEGLCVEQAPWMRTVLAGAYGTDRAGAVSLAARHGFGLAAQAVDRAVAATAELITETAAEDATAHHRKIAALAA